MITRKNGDVWRKRLRRNDREVPIMVIANMLWRLGLKKLAVRLVMKDIERTVERWNREGD